MKIGFPFDINGPGGTRSWIKTFSEYCVNKGHEVFFNHEANVDVFITIANVSNEEQLKSLKERGAKIIHRMDGIFFDYFLFPHESSKEINDSLVKVMEYADLIICQSKFTENLIKYLLKRDDFNRAIIYNGTNKNRFSPQGEKIEKATDKKVILSIAYWGTWKMAEFSIKTIINTAKLLENKEDYEFWVLGQAYPQTELFIKQANLSNITRYDLNNPISHDKIAEYLRGIDLVLHTRPNDSCSNLIIEAMTVNTPVVGLESGSTPELLENCGLMGKCYGTIEELPVVDHEDLANKILKTFQEYDYYKNKIVERSKDFSQEKMSEEYLREICKLLEEDK